MSSVRARALAAAVLPPWPVGMPPLNRSCPSPPVQPTRLMPPARGARPRSASRDRLPQRVTSPCRPSAQATPWPGAAPAAAGPRTQSSRGGGRRRQSARQCQRTQVQADAAASCPRHATSADASDSTATTTKDPPPTAAPTANSITDRPTGCLATRNAFSDRSEARLPRLQPPPPHAVMRHRWAAAGSIVSDQPRATPAQRHQSGTVYNSAAGARLRTGPTRDSTAAPAVRPPSARDKHTHPCRSKWNSDLAPLV